MKKDWGDDLRGQHLERSCPALHTLGLVSGRPESVLQKFKTLGIIINQQDHRIIVGPRRDMLVHGFQQLWLADWLCQVIRGPPSETPVLLIYSREKVYGDYGCVPLIPPLHQ